jgi:hypothetical protein
VVTGTLPFSSPVGANHVGKVKVHFETGAIFDKFDAVAVQNPPRTAGRRTVTWELVLILEA